MECLLCKMWARMPYAKKWSTPTSVQETEGALIVGYWVASRSNTVVRLCGRHMNVIAILDQQEEERIAVTEKVQVEKPTIEQVLQSAPQNNVALIVPQPTVAMPPIIPFIPPKPLQTAPIPDFKLGPFPLRNENTVTDPPPLPMAMDLSAPYQNRAAPGTAEGAIEAARMAPVEGAKISYPCPSCGKEVSTGDVHACDPDLGWKSSTGESATRAD